MAGKRKRGNANPGSPASKRAKKASVLLAPPAPTKPSLEPLPFAETPNPDDRKREAALYELLGSEDEAERIAAADCIVSSLLQGSGASEAVLRRHLDRRLFRGLASGRNAARLGFSLVITEILSQLYGPSSQLGSSYAGLTFEQSLALLVDKTQTGGKISGQEERDHYFGQLFGIECFVRSRILFCDVSRWDRILELLLKLGNKKSWLRPQCGWVMVQAMEQMDQEQVEKLLLGIDEAGIAKTAEGVAAWLVALDRHPRLKPKPWRDPLSAKSLNDLTAVLKESFRSSAKDSEEKAQVSGSWSAQLHFVWDIILARFAKGNAAGADAEALTQFWNRVVDDGLFSKNATDGQKFKGFMVFQKMLQGLAGQDEKLQCLFSKNLMTCLMNQAAKEDRYLHRAAIKALKTLESVVHDQPSALVPVLENVIGKNGVYSFDQRTSTKVVDKLLQNVNGENAEGCLAAIRRPIASLSGHGEDEAKVTLRLYAGYLSKVLNALASDVSTITPSHAKRGGAYGPILQELAELAYGNPKDIPQGALTEQFRDVCRSHIESSLARITQRADDFATFCNAVGSMKSASSRTMSDEISSAVDDALSRMKKLLRRHKSSDDDSKSLAQGLAMLHAVSVFQLYNGSPDAMEVLDDLAQFYDRFKRGDGAQGTSELLVEILLSMVARPSSLMRQISHRVFDAFSGQISAEGLALLTAPLASDESSKGEKELFDTADDDVEQEEEEGEEEEEEASGSDSDDSEVEMDSDVEIVEMDAENDKAADDDEKEKDGENFELLVGEILKSHRLDKDNEADSSSSEGTMSDTEMLALDEKLAEVFKQQAKARPDTKKQKREAKQSVVNFKHRILDLLDTYVQREALNPLSTTLLVPLLRLMRLTATKSLAGRACEVLLRYQRSFKKARAGGSNKSQGKTKGAADLPSVDDVVALLVQVHDEAGKDKSHAYAKAASAASLTLVSAAFVVDRQAVERVAAVYARTQARWVLGEAQLQSSFFTDWNNWCQNQASQARMAVKG
ncbi:hypothetical protein CP533_2270 [Ophiocordyceps camponoti-saundersi (nom. inval.)]|nr:hypothetical protein CP533_2270 [Ophiocordyceps camponoti-saundersi (nom. inval.)]